MPYPFSPSASRWISTTIAVALAISPMALAISPMALAQPNLPELGDPSGADMSAQQERKLGESVIRQIRLSGGYLSDPEVNGYLNELGNRLVTAIPGAPFDFEFFAVADPSINAFALPGGYVGVNVGLILLTQSESELASVLAHEISHVKASLARSVSSERRQWPRRGARAESSRPAAGTNSGDAQARCPRRGIASDADQLTRQNENERPWIHGLDAAGRDVTRGDSWRNAARNSLHEAQARPYLASPVTYAALRAQARAQSQAVSPDQGFTRFKQGSRVVRSTRGRHATRYVFEDAIARKIHERSQALRHGGSCCAGDLTGADRAGDT